ncbi:ion channel TACAN-like [Ornithodoros turicata]|uniref:Putative conserved plasma membrane protein n=1 Tax=Ornithodoros turicata TaxID=34597 RepID=A0A2R5LMK7_9ACAR
MSDSQPLSVCIEEWDALENEYIGLEKTYRNYLQLMGQLQKAQDTCLKELQHHHYRASQIVHSLSRVEAEPNSENAARKAELLKKIEAKEGQLDDLAQDLPRPNGLYLQIVLGSVNLFLKDAEKYKYKTEYEQFKLKVTVCIVVWSILCIISSYRAVDAILHFLLVWYYCTLTIRESILCINGSRIKGWWRLHHFITTAQAGIIIVWPDGVIYRMFRLQFVTYVCVISFIQFCQFYYQQGCLYRLRALGEGHNMDITISGFRSWMWRGLSFLLPFLYFAYMLQAYNAYTLYHLSKLPQCNEWQVFVSAAVFFILFLGNITTTSYVIFNKLRGRTLVRRYNRSGHDHAHSN